MEAFDLHGSTSVVVGASEGIGAAIALGLASLGSDLILAGRSISNLRTIGEKADEYDVTVHIEPLDVRKVDEIETFALKVSDAYGIPRVLVNSMGGMVQKRALDVEREEWDLIHETHLRGTFFTCRAFAREMMQNAYGKIINLSSTFAFTVPQGAGASVYAAAKAGISQLTAALAVEWAEEGILVNAVAPTSTRTPRVDEFYAEHPDRETYITERIPLGRLATPEDVVGPTLFLASRLSDFITGHTLLVDGGWTPAK